MRDELRFVPLAAEHFFAIEPQESQRTQYGVAWADMDWSAAEHMAAQDHSWTVLRGNTVLAIFGINETFPTRQGVAFAVFAEGLGRDHFALTRFAREEVIGKCELTRLEAIVRCIDVEERIAGEPALAGDAGALLALAQWNATPQVRWAIDVGFMPCAVLRKFCAASETHLLLERIR